MKRDDDIIQRLEARDRAGIERTKAILIAEGRPDLAADLDAKVRDIRLGIDGARGAWAALSKRQRLVLGMLCSGFKLRRSARKATLFDAIGTKKTIRDVCRLSTLRNLSARELAHVSGGATDPEAEFVVTERGRFVRKHGEVK